jgi:hypothetical protein
MQRTPLLGAGIKVRPLRAAAASEVPRRQAEMLELTDDRRARLMAFVEGANEMPDGDKERILAQLSQDRVPARVVQRIEARMGG